MKDYLWQLGLYCVLVYLFANINYSIIISKLFSKPDIRTVGSGNPGTTNMFRSYGFKYGMATFLLDMGKSLISALCGLWIFNKISGSYEIAHAAACIGGLMAVIGHVLPVFLKFKGGKGFACSIGMFLVVNPYFTLAAIAVGFIIFLLLDRMSVFALIFVTSQLVWTLIFGLDNLYTLCTTILVWLIVVTAHFSNIKRLIQGNENPTGIHKTLAKLKRKKDGQD